MQPDEGVIKFDLRHRSAPPLPAPTLRALNGWRSLLFRLGLIGRDPARYDGAGYGNVSRRLGAGRPPRFAISGSQTGHLPTLAPAHYAVVTDCDAARNRVVAQGPVAPSSESLTHDMLYRLDPRIGYVFHVHAPCIWARRASLGMPSTDPAIPYGTVAMAEAVAALFDDPAVRRARVFAMGGHEDGLVAFGRTADQAGAPLVSLLARALAG
ncbi:class II aldolase/adducin family protein [Ectothiorhodospiraceae bacterium 2226]|nr:class II aldolase/adducin family protein [Ectothiorhodospiraceae bacterium 2226]